MSKIIFKSATLNEDGSEEQELEVRFSKPKSENRQRHFKVLEILIHTHMYETFKVWVKRKEGKQRVEVVARQVVIIIIATTTNIIIIVIIIIVIIRKHITHQVREEDREVISYR